MITPFAWATVITGAIVAYLIETNVPGGIAGLF